MAGLGCLWISQDCPELARAWYFLPRPWSPGDSISLWTAPCSRPQFPDLLSPCHFDKIGGKGHQIATVGDEPV